MGSREERAHTDRHRSSVDAIRIERLITVSTSEFLRRVPLFDALDSSEMDALAELAFTRSFTKGQLIILVAESGDSLFIIRQGQVKVSLLHGRRRILRRAGIAR